MTRCGSLLRWLSVLMLTSCALQLPTAESKIEDLVARDQLPLNGAELRELRDSLGGERLMESICDQWGRHSKEMDLTVLRLIYATIPPRNKCVIDGRMLASLIARVEEDPSLLRQVWWNRRWGAEDRMPGDYTKPFLVAHFDGSSDSLSVRYGNSPGRNGVFPLFLMASMLDRPDLVAGVTLENIDGRWRSMLDELRVSAPYYRYVEESGTYVLDEEAMRTRQEVGIADQAYTSAATELPPREYP